MARFCLGFCSVNRGTLTQWGGIATRYRGPASARRARCRRGRARVGGDRRALRTRGEEAAEYYVSLLPDSVIETVSRPEPGKPAMIVELSLAGTPYMLLNGGPQYKLSPAASIAVRTADQAETDRLWSALLSGGGEERVRDAGPSPADLLI